MPRTTPLAFLLMGILASPVLAGPDTDGYTWATITHPGNPAYPGNQHGIHAGRGSVDYVYRISKLEVSTGDWLEFANAFSMQSDELDDLLFRRVIWQVRPDFDYHGPGTRYVYGPTGLDEPWLSPIGVTWRQAAMYCNWLHNGKSTDPNALMDGAYDVSTFGIIGASYTDQDTRHPDAKYWIPSLDEWLKAAHYDPDKSGQGPGWWTYGHASDEPPIQGLPGEGHTVIGMPWDDVPGSPIGFPLGAYADVASPWGLHDIIGGHSEYTEEWFVDGFGNNRARLYKESSNLHWWDPERDEIWNFNYLFPHSRGQTSFRIASRPPCPSDLAPPYGTLDAVDLAAYLDLFLSADPAADTAEPFGVINFFDLAAYLASFNAGCGQ